MAEGKSRKVTITVDSGVHEAAVEVMGELGISFSAAVQLFESAVVRERGIPFSLSLRSGRMVEYEIADLRGDDQDD